MKKIINPFSEFLDLLFPLSCFVCRKRIEHGLICRECEAKLNLITNFCSVCGSYDQDNDCRICRTNNFKFDKARSVFYYDLQLKSLIHDLKYSEMTKVARFLSEKTKSYLIEYNPFPDVDIITPVPLHRVKKRTRGFNQAEKLTEAIASAMKWQHEPNLIRRKRFTQTQTKLSKSDRKKNVEKAFTLKRKKLVENKNILIVDDVFTTGSTVNSISELLKDNDAAKVYILTIARA